MAQKPPKYTYSRGFRAISLIKGAIWTRCAAQVLYLMLCYHFCMTIELLDVSGDAGIRVTGPTLDDAFMAAGVGMYQLITDTGRVRDLSHITVDVDADSPETLLVRYLNELIFRFDTDAFVGSRVVVRQMSSPEAGGGWRFRAEVHGEEFDGRRHEQRALLKAATYHALKIAESDDIWTIEVVFDI